MTAVRAKGKTIHAHPLVLSTAQGIAQGMFEEFITRGSRGNVLFENMKRANPGLDSVGLQEKFVRRMAPLLLGEARTTLAQLLGQTTQKDLQERIHDALIRDNSLRRGRVRV